MRTQIGTKRYSTDSARLVGAGSLENVGAYLYLKKSGEAFLHINPFSKQFSQIKPITEQQAENFAEKNGFLKDFLRIKKYLTEPKQPITLMLPSSIVKDILEVTQSLGVNQSECFYEMLANGYQQKLKELYNRAKAIEELENLST